MAWPYQRKQKSYGGCKRKNRDVYLLNLAKVLLEAYAEINYL